DSVLLIGAASGYVAALLAHMARHVTVLESSPELKELAAKNLNANGVRNVDLILANGLSDKHTGTYDAILVADSLDEIPENLKQQLNVGGRLLVVVGQLPMMTAKLVTRQTNTEFSTKDLFDTVVQAMPGVLHASHFTL
ncbi:MAG: protein-L-isoaspartate O-methyltransferase, partial [Burkholderiales bacterium]|nr:protein-L-isoaspartate O-methyltransferase [Burkholderiales bacterium]